jgi:antitoxin ParD1/3/4
MVAKVQKISIALPKEMVADIRQAVDSGRYATTSEVVRQAVREWTQREQEIPKRVRVPATREEFRRTLAESIAQADRGEVKPAKEVFDRLEAKYAAKVPPTKKRTR